MVVQQIHSFRWIGVRPFHLASICASEVNTFSMSAGTICTTPAAISFFIHLFFSFHLRYFVGFPVFVGRHPPSLLALSQVARPLELAVFPIPFQITIGLPIFY